ncbi:hypothetical protein NL676_039346 [Syzygium grande]|nr:hypothetical protein NL676_039346 [Syzygium grande]
MTLRIGASGRRNEQVQSTPSKLTGEQVLTELRPAGGAMIGDDASGAGRRVVVAGDGEIGKMEKLLEIGLSDGEFSLLSSGLCIPLDKYKRYLK